MSEYEVQRINYVEAQRPHAIDVSAHQVLSQVAQAATAMPTNAAIDAGALRSLETVSERSTPVDRAIGVAIKAGVVLFIASLATYALGVAGASGGEAAVFFVVVLLGSISVLYWLDYSHSPIGGERYKAKLFADIRRQEIQSQERIMQAKLQAYGKTLERVYNRRDGGVSRSGSGGA